MEDLNYWLNQQDLVVVRPIKQDEEDKFILVLGIYRVSPIIFDTREEAEEFLEKNFKFNNFELSIIGAMCSQLNKIEKQMSDNQNEEK